MSKQDRELLEKAGLTAAKAAQLLEKSRQAVSKGIGGEADYFAPSDLVELNDAVARSFPDQHPQLQTAVRALFESLAEQLGASAEAPSGLGPAIEKAHRLWLILPGYPVSYLEQPEAYNGLFSAIDARRPELSFESSPLDIVVFCDRGRQEIEDQLDYSWITQKQVALVQCDVVGKMIAPIVVVDPHLENGRACYALAAGGFEQLAPGLARVRVSDFAEHVSQKIRMSRRVEGKQLNMLTTPSSALIAAGIEEV